VLPHRGNGCGVLSTDVKGSTVVVTLILGGVSQPSQSSRFRGAKVFRELAPLAFLKIDREIVWMPCGLKTPRKTRNTSHHSESTLALKVH
jgi:hypothetical protein